MVPSQSRIQWIGRSSFGDEVEVDMVDLVFRLTAVELGVKRWNNAFVRDGVGSRRDIEYMQESCRVLC